MAKGAGGRGRCFSVSHLCSLRIERGTKSNKDELSERDKERGGGLNQNYDFKLDYSFKRLREYPKILAVF